MQGDVKNILIIASSCEKNYLLIKIINIIFLLMKDNFLN